MSSPGADADLAPRVAAVLRSRLLSTALDTVLAIALIRLLPKQQFAVLGLAFVVYELGKQLAIGGFADSLLVLLPNIAAGARRKFAFRTARLLVATGALAALVMILMAVSHELWLTNWEAPERQLLERVLACFALVALFEFPTVPLMQLLLALDHQRAAGRWEIATSVAGLAALVGPVLLGFGVFGSAIAIAGWSVARAVIALSIAHAVLPRSSEALPREVTRAQLEFALPLGLNTLVTRLNKHGDKLLVTLLLPSTALAEYAAASHELPFVTVFPYAIGSLLVSRFALAFAQSDTGRVARLWHASARRVSLVVVPAAAWSIVTAPDLLRLAFGPGYAAAVLPFQIFSAILLTRVAQYGAILQAARDTRSILRFSAITVVLNLALGSALTPVLGIVGTALGTLVANLVGLSLFLRRIARHLGVATTETMPFRHWFVMLGISTAAGALTWVLRTAVDTSSPGAAVLLQTTFFAALVATFMRPLRLWSRDETKALKLLLGY